MSIEKLNACIKKHNANHSHAREALYKILLASNECLNVTQISDKLHESYPKKISLNTLYRHLGFFTECNLIIAIQDDYKRAYYFLKGKMLMTFCVCTRCKSISKLHLDKKIEDKELVDSDFITVHKRCFKCQLLN